MKSLPNNDNSNLTVSVAMAVYNGERFIKEQIDSILVQLRETDELIISYNQSSDATYSIISKYASLDKRIKIIVCQEKGVIPNFECAILNSKNDVIFLSDQDDCWQPNKIAVVLDTFYKEDCLAVMHNSDLCDEQLNSINQTSFDRGTRNGTVSNILKNCFQGSCLAFKKELKQLIIPIPRSVAMHDQWIGIIASQADRVCFVDAKLMMYRQHGDNCSGKRLPIFRKLSFMMNISFHLIKRHKIIRLYKSDHSEKNIGGA